MHYMFDNYPALWSPYGFRDGFNLTSNPDWYGPDVLGIDQGPIIIMIENARNQRPWLRFMQNADVQRGLGRATFTPVSGIPDGNGAPAARLLAQNRPNPFRDVTRIEYVLETRGPVRLNLYDVTGRLVRRLVDRVELAGNHEVTLGAGDLPAGTYWYRLESGGRTESRKALRIN